MFIPDGNPNNVSPADITNWLGHDVVKIRYVWNGFGESQPEQEPTAEGPDGGERAAGPIQGADGADFTPIGQPAGSAVPPTPTLAQAARYVDPARTAAAAWRAIAALSPPSQPTVPRGADGQGGTVARPDTGSGETAGSSKLAAYGGNDPINRTGPTDKDWSSSTSGFSQNASQYGLDTAATRTSGQISLSGMTPNPYQVAMNGGGYATTGGRAAELATAGAAGGTVPAWSKRNTRQHCPRYERFRDRTVIGGNINWAGGAS